MESSLRHERTVLARIEPEHLLPFLMSTRHSVRWVCGALRANGMVIGALPQLESRHDVWTKTMCSPAGSN